MTSRVILEIGGGFGERKDSTKEGERGEEREMGLGKRELKRTEKWGGGLG